MRRFLGLVFGLALVAPAGLAAQWSSGRPDGHAPIGVMVDHGHEQGEIMLSYRYMYMDMVGNRDGTDRLSIAEIFDAAGPYRFMIAPTQMSMQMHMFGAMYAPIDRVTLVATLPVLDLSMDHVTRTGVAFTTRSANVGDLRLGGLIQLAKFGNQSLHAGALVALPIGATDETGVTPASAPRYTLLPYPMQTGSGTFDLLPSITYLGQTDWWSWGGQASATIRTGTNDNDYSLGDRFSGTFWGARRFNDWVSASARLEGTTWGNIEGADPRLPGPGALMVPTARPDLRGGSRVDAGVGVNVYVRRGLFKATRIALEGMVPIYQDLDGPQLETDWTVTAGIQYTIF